MLEDYSEEWVAAVAFLKAENHIHTAQLVLAAGQGSLGAHSPHLLWAEAHALMPPNSRRKAAHLRDADPVRDPGHQELAQLGATGLAFGQPFVLDGSAPNTARSICNAQVLGNRRDSDLLALGHFSHGRLHSRTRSNPSGLFEGHF